MQVLVYDFRWQDEHHAKVQAAVGSRLGERQIQIGDQISLEVKSDVRCGGAVDPQGKYHPCEQQITGRTKCELCRNRERNFIYTMFDGFNTDGYDESELAKMQGEHLVYLALFNQGLSKVGVCKAERRALRQMEQGSAFTLFVARTPDGIAARQMETLLRRDGCTDKIKPSQKKDFLCPEITPEAAKQELLQKLEKHKNALQDYERLQGFLLKELEFVDWEEHYNTHSISDSSKPFHTLKLGKDEWVSGTILAIKGPFVVVETPEELVSICAKDLFGREVEFEKKPAGVKLNAAIQNALF